MYSENSDTRDKEHKNMRKAQVRKQQHEGTEEMAETGRGACLRT